MDTHRRSIAKAVSYRLLGSITTALIIFLLTGRPGMSIGAGVLDIFSKIGLYFLHERLWDRIDFGRRKQPEYEI
jgi:adenylylsulfate kinase